MGNGDDELRRLILSADWDDLTKRWIAYAVHCLARRGVQEGKYRKMAPEYVHRMVKEILNNEHHYFGGGLFPFGCAVIDARIRKDLGR